MTSSPSFLSYAFFWNFKSPPDNLWHPLPFTPQTPSRYTPTNQLPHWLLRCDPAATVVDAFPIVTFLTFLRHASQLTNLGLGAPWSPFSNPATLRTAHRSSLIAVPVILGLQAVGADYRYAIPRWAGERERRRDEGQARRHVEVGMLVGGLIGVTRAIFKRGPRWAIVDVVIGGGVADLALREYYKAHEGD
nr:hypothetical protein B0A51_03937 [Rachicladosporium sp. CCFEE 5018]